jgi:hypothetical protein
VRLEGLGQLKKILRIGARSTIFRLVEKCLNQLRYRVPRIVFHYPFEIGRKEISASVFQEKVVRFFHTGSIGVRAHSALLNLAVV